jgi:hypothetical protein
MDTNLQTAIAVLQGRIRSKEEDVIRLKRTVNEMCIDAGEEQPYAGISSSDAASDISSLRSDLFYGQTISASAKTYLEMRKAGGLGAATVNDIFAALKKGGYKFEAKDEENAKNGLRVSLRKNSGVFHRLPNGEYGLLAWYPNAKPAKDEDADDNENNNGAGKNGTKGTSASETQEPDDKPKKVRIRVRSRQRPTAPVASVSTTSDSETETKVTPDTT